MKRRAEVLILILIGAGFGASAWLESAGVISPHFFSRLMPFSMTAAGLFMIWAGFRESLSRYHRLSYTAVGAGGLLLAAPLLFRGLPVSAFFVAFGVILPGMGGCGAMYFTTVSLLREIGRHRRS